ncbi:MAG TPA: hypothetical protein VHL59_10965, partial [Thermoanaerobaculia bacterium]|nr:hypothetical protein [Thermoanaerobaculia bacterium]
MTRRARQLLLALMAALFALTLVVLLLNPRIARDPVPPSDPAAMAAWLARHPADWLTASALADAALDSNVPRRLELWRSSHALAQRLAPRLPNARAAFVRAGLFHWYELGETDRKAVLAAAAPLLRDERLFQSLHRPLWELTRDFAFLRRNAPDSVNALVALRDV